MLFLNHSEEAPSHCDIYLTFSTGAWLSELWLLAEHPPPPPKQSLATWHHILPAAFSPWLLTFEPTLPSGPSWQKLEDILYWFTSLFSASVYPDSIHFECIHVPLLFWQVCCKSPAQCRTKILCFLYLNSSNHPVICLFVPLHPDLDEFDSD